MKLNFRNGPLAIALVLGLSLLTISAAGDTLPSSGGPSPATHNGTSLAVDGASSSFCPNTTSSCTTSLSTTHNNDILIAFTIEGLDIQTSCVFSVSDSSGLSWASRSVDVFGNGGRNQLQEFYTKSAGAVSIDAITESISGCGTNYNGLMVFGVSGANFNAPFDPNTSLAGSAIGSGTTPSVTVSTSHANDMIIGGANLHTLASTGSGFTLITTTDGVNDAAEYQIVQSTVTNLAVTFNAGVPDNWAEVADALQSGQATPDFALAANPTGLSILKGESATSAITVSSIGSFKGIVSLAASIVPTGPVISLNSSKVSVPQGGSGTSVLTVSTTRLTNSGSYTVTITGSKGGLSHSIAIAIKVSSLAVDSAASSFCPNTTASCSATLSTSHNNDIIVAFTIEGLDVQTSCTFSVSDAAGLSWTSRSIDVIGNGGRNQLQEFYATSANPLAADSITESITGCGTNYNGLLTFGVSGANMTTPFDSNGSLPSTNTGSGTSISTNISTTNENDMIIGAANLHGLSSTGNGFTLITTTDGVNDAAEYQTVQSPVANLPVSFNASTADNWIEIADAIQA